MAIFYTIRLKNSPALPNDKSIWLQLHFFTSRTWLYGLSTHFYTENLEMQGILYLLTLITRELILLQLKIQSGGG